MITLDLAIQLKEAGLVWQTSVNDFFGVPERGLDDKVFVISDLMVTMELVQGWPALTFHGTAEWAADYLMTHDAVWLPTEEQLRHELETRLASNGRGTFQLSKEGQQYHLQIAFWQEKLRFDGDTATAVYAQALLHILRSEPS